MTESPEQMTRRILRDRYPRPQTPTLTAALMIAAAPHFAPLERVLYAQPPAAPVRRTPCRLCGCWGGHHDGCKMPR